MITKKCKACKEVKPGSEYHGHPQTKDKLQVRCKECNATAQREWWHSLDADQRKDRVLRQQFNMSLADYRMMFFQQDGKCAICHRPETRMVVLKEDDNETVMALAVDHDHACCPGKKSCGKCVRALLCHRCNKGFGLLEEDVDILLSMIAYKRTHAAVAA